MMRWLFILALCAPLSATTYFVSNAGSNAANGTTSGTSWAFAPGMAGCTSVCASTTLVPGDTVQLNKGDQWRDAITMPASGSAGNPITYMSYGSGSHPILNGSIVASNGGFSLSSGKTLTYQRSQTTDPFAAFENGALLLVKTSIATVEATSGTFWWDGSANLYIHASDDSNVSSNGKLYEVGNSSGIVYNLWTNGKSYNIVDGIDGVNSLGAVPSSVGGFYDTGDHNIFRNLTVHDTNRYAVMAYNTSPGSTNLLVDHVTTYNVGAFSFTCFSPGAGATFQNSAQYLVNANWQALSASEGQGSAGIKIGNGATGCVYQNMEVHDVAGTVNDAWVTFINSSTGNTVKNSAFFGAGNAGINCTAGSNNNSFYDNTFVISSLGTGKALFNLVGCTGWKIHNNSIYGSNTQPVISATSTSTGLEAKNNAIKAAANCFTVDASSITSSAIDYSDCYAQTGNYGSWNGTAYASFAAWKAGSSQDGNVIAPADPLWNNPSAGDFTLLSGSPLIDSGSNLGSTFQSANDPAAASWPYSQGVQGSYGAAWEIGAFLYTNIPQTPASLTGNGTLSGSATLSVH